MKKPVVLLDLDGVLVDFDQAVANQYYEITGKIILPKYFYNYNVIGHIKCSKRIKEQIIRAINARGFSYFQMRPYRGVIKTTKKLMKIADVVFVTKPWSTSETWCHDRTSFLENYFGEKIKIIFTGEKEYTQGRYFIDDNADNIVKWQKANPNGEAFLMDRPYNKKYKLPRIYDLNNMFRIIKDQQTHCGRGKPKKP